MMSYLLIASISFILLHLSDPPEVKADSRFIQAYAVGMGYETDAFPGDGSAHGAYLAPSYCVYDRDLLDSVILGGLLSVHAAILREDRRSKVNIEVPLLLVGLVPREGGLRASFGIGPKLFVSDLHGQLSVHPGIEVRGHPFLRRLGIEGMFSWRFGSAINEPLFAVGLLVPVNFSNPKAQ